MKVLVSWALRNPQDWETVDASQWRSLPNRGIPLLGERGDSDNEKGRISNISVQGLCFNGQDHIAIEPLTIGNDTGIKAVCWNDDPDDYPIGQRVARIWQFLPLAPDPYLGFAINTRQHQVVYAEGDRYDRFMAEPPGFTVRPWAEFENNILQTIDPAITRHGIWVPDEHWDRQVQACTPTGWMHWNEHLPESECEWEVNEIRHNGRMRELRTPRRVLKCQRDQGRYRQAEHTITYIQRDTNRANDVAVFLNEDALELTTGSSVTETVITDANIKQAWRFSAPANEPNSADWPNGVYHQQLNCTAASAGLTYGVSSFNAFAKHNAALTSSIASAASAGGTLEFSGTGLKLQSSAAWDPAAGSANERYVTSLEADGGSHGDAITLTLNTADSYADGPWVVPPLVGSKPGGYKGAMALQQIIGR